MFLVLRRELSPLLNLMILLPLCHIELANFYLLASMAYRARPALVMSSRPPTFRRAPQGTLHLASSLSLFVRWAPPRCCLGMVAIVSVRNACALLAVCVRVSRAHVKWVLHHCTMRRVPFEIIRCIFRL